MNNNLILNVYDVLSEHLGEKIEGFSIWLNKEGKLYISLDDVNVMELLFKKIEVKEGE